MAENQADAHPSAQRCQLEQQMGSLDSAVRLYRHVRRQGGDDDEEMMTIVADLIVERYDHLRAALLGPGM